MMCRTKIMHTIEAGDSLYKLAKKYDTTVTELILGNPGANPYNLQIGAKLQICPGARYLAETENGLNLLQPNMWMQNENMSAEETEESDSPIQNESENEDTAQEAEVSSNAVKENTVCMELGELQTVLNNMRLSWLNQICWIRMYLMSVMAHAKDLSDVEERMLETADEITDAYTDYLPMNVLRELHDLFLKQTELIGAGVRSLDEGKKCNYHEWQDNAEQLTKVFEAQNSYYANNTVHNMLFNYLDMTYEEIEEQMGGRYGKSIATFGSLQDQAIKMADFLAGGLFVQ